MGYQFPRIAADWPDAIGEGWRARFTPENAADLSERFVASGTEALEASAEGVGSDTAESWATEPAAQPSDLLVSTDPGDDANWLMIRIDLVGGGARLHTVEPCLTTHEARELADFLDSGLPGELTFLEPTLRISVSEIPESETVWDGRQQRLSTRIRVRVRVEPVEPALPAVVDVDITPDDLRSAIGHWRGQLAMYPTR